MADTTLDGEFRLAARHWTGALRLEIDERTTGFVMRNGGADWP